MTDKNDILAEIKRLAARAGGKPPGVGVFERETGVRRDDWFPHLWLRWGEALSEAGYTPNKLQSAYTSDFLAEKYIALVRELGHIPVKGELLRKAKADKSFPSNGVLYKDGKEALLKLVVNYCESHPGYDDVLTLCRNELTDSSSHTAERKDKIQTGFVYLMKSGRYYKIGRTVSVGSRERQLAIKIPVPPTTIHKIETDDPVGVEAYWHRRFAEKRGEGEWFDLSREDVAAFKRWKRIV